MKKVLAAFMIALLVFTGCKNQKFTLYIYGDESGYYTEADAELPVYTGHRAYDSIAVGKRSVAFNGKEYEGTFFGSEYDYLSGCRADVYDFTGGHFAVDAGNGKLLRISFVLPQTGKPIDIEEAKGRFDILAAEYADISGWKKEAARGELGYVFDYTYIIDGELTAQNIEICTDRQGNVISFVYTAQDMFDGSEQVPNVKGAARKLCKMSGGIVDQKVLIKLPDGQMGVLYSITAQGETTPFKYLAVQG